MKKYQIFCNTENSNKFWLLPDTANHIPNKCPDDTNHDVNLASVAQIEETSAKEVITVFEKNDKTIKLASATADTNIDTGEAVILLQVPGNPLATNEGRWLDGGIGWFDNPHKDDRFYVHILDHDGILGMGPDLVVGSYTDDEMPPENQGWRVPRLNRPVIEVETLAGYGYAPSGLYLRIVGQKGFPVLAPTDIDLDSHRFVYYSHRFSNCMPCRLKSSDTLPMPLQPNITYYLSNVTPSGFALAETKVKAAKGEFIHLTDIGIGSHSVIVQDTMYVNLSWGRTE